MLVPIIVSILDPQTVREWETKLNNLAMRQQHKHIPTFQELFTFLITKSILETLPSKHLFSNIRSTQGRTSQTNVLITTNELIVRITAKITFFIHVLSTSNLMQLPKISA